MKQFIGLGLFYGIVIFSMVWMAGMLCLLLPSNLSWFAIVPLDFLSSNVGKMITLLVIINSLTGIGFKWIEKLFKL